MNVFTDDWIQELHKQYDRLKPHERPDLYFVAIDEQFQNMRQEIEAYVAALPPTRKLISDLRSPDNFQHTYHELVVGNVLFEHGYQPEYDKQIDTLTPDWYVPSTDNTPAFLVEVVTTDAPSTRVTLQRRVEDLLVRLEAIRIGVVLGITLNNPDIELNPQRAKSIARKVQTWLLEKPSTGAFIEIESFSFKILRYDSRYTNIHYQGPSIKFKIDEERLRRTLLDKVKKYKDLSTLHKLPLIVAIFTGFSTLLDYENLKNVLFSQKVFLVNRDSVSGDVIDYEPGLKLNGLFGKRPVLSGVLWIDEKQPGTRIARLIRNPAASQPLPHNTFVKKTA